MAQVQNAFYHHLGQRIRELREAKEMTQAHVAERVGLSRASVVNIERGRQPVALHTAVKLKEIFSLESVEDLYLTRESGTDRKMQTIPLHARNKVADVIARFTKEEK